MQGEDMLTDVLKAYLGPVEILVYLSIATSVPICTVQNNK